MKLTRRKILAGSGLALVGAATAGGLWAYSKLVPQPAEVGFLLSAAELAAAFDFLKRYPAIDSHAHPGRTFIKGASGLTWKLWLYQKFGTYEPRVIEDMCAGGMAAVSFSGVADFPVLDAVPDGLVSVREFKPGEAWAYYQAQLVNLQALVGKGLVKPVLEPGDVEAAHKSGVPGAMFAIEGGDFAADDPAHIEQAAKDGVRMITLVHYLGSSTIGDIQTARPVNGGLTKLGATIVGEMNRNRIMLDLSHASEKTAMDALDVTKLPAVATHTHIASLGIGHARFISPELAKAIAATGGYIGAWPAGIGISTLEGFIKRIGQLIDTVGIDHVAIGTDMDANFKPVLETYRKMPLVVGELLKRGMAEADLAKIIGGNFLRVFEQTRAG